MKTIEGNSNRRLKVRVRVRFLLFSSELAPNDPWCNMLHDFTWTEKIRGENVRWTSFQDSIREMLTVTIYESFILFYFIFDSKYYRQHDGVAMGSPLGPTFTNIFLYVHEILWLEKSLPEFRIVIYKRYVDDIFLLF